MRSSMSPIMGLLLSLVLGTYAESVVLERVIALVGNSPLYYSEFLEFRRTMKEEGRYRSDSHVLEALIDRKLLELEARRLRLDTGVSDTDALIDRYLELAVRGSLIRSRFRGQVFYGATDEGAIPDRSSPDVPLRMGKGGEDLPEFEQALKQKLGELRKRYEVRIIPSE